VFRSIEPKIFSLGVLVVYKNMYANEPRLLTTLGKRIT
jgi:hypothetical protein